MYGEKKLANIRVEHATEELHLEVCDGDVILIYVSAYINCICSTSLYIIYTTVKNDS